MRKRLGLFCGGRRKKEKPNLNQSKKTNVSLYYIFDYFRLSLSESAFELPQKFVVRF